MATQNIQKIKINELKLWSENPRDPINPKSTDFDIIKRAIDENPSDWNLEKLVADMGDYYDFSEIPTVVYVDNTPVVFDGNRRIAVIKYLQDRDLFSALTGRLFPNNEPKELCDLFEIPCNVCDKETALINIERKHANNGSWSTLQREYFLHQHRGQTKSLFLIIEEQTGLISANPSLNQRFVKDEILTEKNLKDIGFAFENGKLVSGYDESQNKEILQKVASLLEDKDINTRKNRGLLKKALIDKYPENKSNIIMIDDTKPKKPVISNFRNDHEKDSSNSSSRRTSTTLQSDELFGRILYLKKGVVNDLYRGITEIYERFKDKEYILPLVGMSLRLILDVAGRLYYEGKDEDIAQDDQISKRFIKDAKRELKNNFNQKTKNSVSLTQDWISDKYSIEGILNKYAHGNIDYSKQTIVQTSTVVADILEHFFGKLK